MKRADASFTSKRRSSGIPSALLGALALVPLVVTAIDKQPDACLYAVYEGPNSKVLKPPCEYQDPLGVSKDADVLAVMSAMQIDPASVHFRGCESGRFAAGQDNTQNPSQRYVITYSTEAKSRYLAPTTHELAHVLQMESFGGLKPLVDQVQDSRRIELAADYLAGVVFSKLVRNSDRFDAGEFQNDLTLIGLYFEEASGAHGSPEQRTAAFRFGLMDGPQITDLRAAHDHFQDDIYGRVLQN